MSELSATREHHKAPDETRNISVDFRYKLDTGELLTSGGAMSATPDGLTFSNVAINSGTITVAGQTCLPGQAVQGKVVGGVAGTTYKITVSAVSNASPAQTLSVFCVLVCKNS